MRIIVPVTMYPAKNLMKNMENIFRESVFTIPTFSSSKLNAIVYSFLATIRSLFGHYDIVHFHAEGPCIMLWLTKLFGIPTVATIHGLDWQRSKWGNFASHMLKLGEKTAALHADEVIVLSHNMQDYFQETYGRKTRFIPNGINRPILKGDSEIKAKVWSGKRRIYPVPGKNCTGKGTALSAACV